MPAILALFLLYTRHSTPTNWYVIGGITAIVIAALYLSWYLDRKRRRELAAALEARGYVLNTTDFTSPEVLHYRPEKRHRLYRAYWSALGIHNGRPAHIAEYSYNIRHGKNSHEYRIIEVALDFPSPASFKIIPHTTAFSRFFTGTREPSDNPTGNAAFDSRWDIDTVTPGLLADVINPPHYAMLLSAPKQEKQWAVSDGWASCSWQKRPKMADIEAMLARVEQFIIAAEQA